MPLAGMHRLPAGCLASPVHPGKLRSGFCSDTRARAAAAEGIAAACGRWSPTLCLRALCQQQRTHAHGTCSLVINDPHKFGLGSDADAHCLCARAARLQAVLSASAFWPPLKPRRLPRATAHLPAMRAITPEPPPGGGSCPSGTSAAFVNQRPLSRVSEDCALIDEALMTRWSSASSSGRRNEVSKGQRATQAAFAEL